MWSIHSQLLPPDPLWFIVIVLVRVLSISQMDLFANYSYLIRPSAKNSDKTIKQIKCKYFHIIIFCQIVFLGVQRTRFPNLKVWSNPRRIYIPFQSVNKINQIKVRNIKKNNGESQDSFCLAINFSLSSLGRARF